MDKFITDKPVDFLIVTALPVELKAVLELLDDYVQIKATGDVPYHYRGVVSAATYKSQYQVAVVKLMGMGNVNAVHYTQRAIQALTPDYILMVGIAGGLQKDIELGDVIVSEQIFYYDQAKITEEGLQIRTIGQQVDPTLLEAAQHYLETSWRELIKTARPSGRRKTSSPLPSVPEVKFGPFACGEKVVANDDFIKELKKIHPKMACVEMESYGVALAAARNIDRPRFIAFRGISDKSNVRKNDLWHTYAAQAAAAFTVGFLRYEPVEPKEVRANKIIENKTLIAIRHQSTEKLQEKAIANVLPPEYAGYNFIELLIDQSDLYQNGRLIDPLLAAQRQVEIANRLEEQVAIQPDAEIAYYSIAHIPLLFLAGYQLSNRRIIHLFDQDRTTSVWNQLQKGGDIPRLNLVEPKPKRINRTSGDVVVRISISYLVDAALTTEIVTNPIASFHLSIKEPMVDVVRSERQVREYGQVFRSLLDIIHDKFPNTKRIHLFYSGPASVAFHFGQQISKTIHPPLLVYNYFATDTPAYSWGIDITSSVDAPNFLVKPIVLK